MSVGMTVTLQIDAWPARVLISVTGMTVGVQYELRRNVAGVAQVMRNGGILAASSAATVIDAEVPFGVSVTWSVLLSSTGAVLSTAGPIPGLILVGGKVAISDAITGQAAEVVIVSFPARSRTAVQTTFVVDGRNIVVSSGIGQYTGTVDLFVETTAASDALGTLLRTCTSGIVQVRQAGGYDGIDAYWAILGADDQRFSQDGSDQRRIWQLTVAEVDMWAPTLEARGWTLQDLADHYTGQTLTDLHNDLGPTLLVIAQADFG